MSVYASRLAAARGGLGDAATAPALVLGASFIGFGSLCRQAGLTLPQGLFSTATGWALPGQVAAIELYGIGASLLSIALAVALTNARLLPMTMSVVPLLREPGTAAWRYYIGAHFVAVTAWAQAMLRCPALPAAQRLPYFLGFAITLWCTTLLCTGFGYLLAGQVPAYVSLGLVFLNPLYFMLVFLSDLRRRERVLALILGAIMGPILYRLDPDWGLLLTGLIAGGGACLFDGRLRPRACRR